MSHLSGAWLAISGLLISVLLWGSSFVALKFSFQSFDPYFVIFARMLIASICFLCVAWRFGKIKYEKGDIKLIILMVLFEPCFYYLFEAKAISLTTASQAGMITSMMPILVAIGAFFFLKERISKTSLFGFVMAVIGACLLSAGSESSAYAPNPPLGNFLEFMAMACGAAYTIVLKKLTDKYSPFFLTGVQAISGCIFFFFYLLFSQTPFPMKFEPAPSFAVLYLGTFVTLGAYGLYNYGVSKIPANQASAFINLIPVVAIVMGQIMLNENFTFWQYAASAMVLIGVYISQEQISLSTLWITKGLKDIKAEEAICSKHI